AVEPQMRLKDPIPQPLIEDSGAAANHRRAVYCKCEAQSRGEVVVIVDLILVFETHAEHCGEARREFHIGLNKGRILILGNVEQRVATAHAVARWSLSQVSLHIGEGEGA